MSRAHLELVVGGGLGLWDGLRRRRSRGLAATNVVLLSIPTYSLGFIFLFVFAYRLQLAPARGRDEREGAGAARDHARPVRRPVLHRRRVRVDAYRARSLVHAHGGREGPPALADPAPARAAQLPLAGHHPRRSRLRGLPLGGRVRRAGVLVAGDRRAAGARLRRLRPPRADGDRDRRRRGRRGLQPGRGRRAGASSIRVPASRSAYDSGPARGLGAERALRRVRGRDRCVDRDSRGADAGARRRVGLGQVVAGARSRAAAAGGWDDRGQARSASAASTSAGSPDPSSGRREDDSSATSRRTRWQRSTRC